MSKPKLEVIEREELPEGRVRLKARLDFGTGLPRTTSHPMMRDMAVEIASAMAADCVRRGGQMVISADGEIIDIEVREPPK